MFAVCLKHAAHAAAGLRLAAASRRVTASSPLAGSWSIPSWGRGASCPSCGSSPCRTARAISPCRPPGRRRPEGGPGARGKGSGHMMDRWYQPPPTCAPAWAGAPEVGGTSAAGGSRGPTRGQREYRFAMWADGTRGCDRVDLRVSAALLDAVQRPPQEPERDVVVPTSVDGPANRPRHGGLSRGADADRNRRACESCASASTRS